MTESDLLAAIIELARTLNWKTYHARYSLGADPGWPDLTLVHPSKRRVIWAELKGPRGRVSDEQAEWLAALINAEMEAYLWTPAEWLDGTIERLLR